MAGSPVAWKLVPGPLPPLYADPSSEHAKRGAFATKNLWVTPYSDDEFFPAGIYPLEPNPIGIVEWTANVSSLCFSNSDPAGPKFDPRSR
jgi:primary-amine oxidase